MKVGFSVDQFIPVLQGGFLQLTPRHTILRWIKKKQATVHEKNGDVQGATKSLDEAKQIRAKILKRVQVEQPDAVLDHKQLTANICHQMAEHAVNKRDFDTGTIQGPRCPRSK